MFATISDLLYLWSHKFNKWRKRGRSSGGNPFYSLFNAQQIYVKERLVDMDREHKLDSDADSDVISDIESLTDEISQKINHHHCADYFVGYCHKINCGSVYRDTKLGRPDEIDIAFVWDAKTLPQNIEIKLEKVLQKRKETNRLYSGSFLEDDSDIQPFVADVYDLFRKACSDAVRDVSLPDGWIHGGILSPVFSGYRHNGPALMFQFICSKPDQDDLVVNIDMVLVMPVQVKSKTRSCQKETRFRVLAKSGSLDTIWLMVAPSKLNISYTLAENNWFGKFHPDSSVKKAIRILKILNDEEMDIHSHNINYPPNYRRVRSEIDRLCGDNCALNDAEKVAILQDKGISVKILQLADNDRQSSQKFLDEMKEIYKPLHKISSYTIQSIVMLIYSLCYKAHPNHQPLWTDSHIADVVVTALDIMMVCLKAKEEYRHVDIKLRLTLNGYRCRSLDIPKLMFKSVFDDVSLLSHVEGMIRTLRDKAGHSQRGELPDVFGKYTNENKKRNTHIIPALIIYKCIWLESR